jgi:hypothetical protein
MGTVKNIRVSHESARFVDQTSDDALPSVESGKKGSNNYFETVTSSISIV